MPAYIIQLRWQTPVLQTNHELIIEILKIIFCPNFDSDIPISSVLRAKLKSCRSWAEFWEIQISICEEMCKKLLVLTKSCQSQTDGPALVSNTESVHDFAHATTAQLSWHVQNRELIGSLFVNSEQNIILRFGLWAYGPIVWWVQGPAYLAGTQLIAQLIPVFSGCKVSKEMMFRYGEVWGEEGGGGGAMDGTTYCV